MLGEYSGSWVFVLGIGSAVVSALASFVIVSLSIAWSRNKRREELVAANRLQAIPDAIVVENGDEHGDGGSSGPGGSGNNGGPSKRKETAEDKRNKKLKEMEIPLGEVYDASYGKRERPHGLCYSVFTRKSTVMLHLQWTKVMSVILMVMQVGFLVMSIYRGLYILAFPQYGVAGVVTALLTGLFSFHQQAECCIRWCVLCLLLPVVFACDLVDSATLSVEYACIRDGSPCSNFEPNVVLSFFCLRMISVFVTVWLALLSSFLNFEMGCCSDTQVYSYWALEYDSKMVSLDVVPTKDFTRRKGKDLLAAIQVRKAEIAQQKELEQNPQGPVKKPIAFLPLSGGGRSTKKSVFKSSNKKHATEGRAARRSASLRQAGAGGNNSDEDLFGPDSDLDEEPSQPSHGPARSSSKRHGGTTQEAVGSKDAGDPIDPEKAKKAPDHVVIAAPVEKMPDDIVNPSDNNV